MVTSDRASDAELVRASLERDGEAYRELVARYQGHVYGLAYSLVGDWSEAQDIAQETFVRVHLNLNRLRDPERFAPWLRRVTFSVTMNWLRAFRPRIFEQLDVPWVLVRDSDDHDVYPSSFVFEWPHLSFGFLRERRAAPERREVVLRSLRTARDLAHTRAFETYASGFAAYDFWVETLRDDARFEDAEKREVAMNANAHCYYSLFDARTAAATYLREVAPELEPVLAEPLSRAADLYARIAEILPGESCVTDVAPMRWKLGEKGTWTAEQRRAQADLLAKARALEEQAVREIETALAAA